MATAALILSIVGFVAWVFPLFGFPVSLAGLILGIVSLKKQSPGRQKAKVAVILCSIEIILGLILNAYYAYFNNISGF